LNRSELKTRLGFADPDVTLPRVPGIEATGVVAACPGSELAVGQQVVAMMGGMGRSFDGGYAEFTCVPAAQAIPFRSELPWTTLGAVPEMLQTAYGAHTAGLDVQPDQTLLIRGGTSSVGLTAAILAKRRGLTVLATTRSEAKAGALRESGADHVVVDDGARDEESLALLPVAHGHSRGVVAGRFATIKTRLLCRRACREALLLPPGSRREAAVRRALLLMPQRAAARLR
jgi:NADPH:quinone reductase